jgi:hypothetical protein
MQSQPEPIKSRDMPSFVRSRGWPWQVLPLWSTLAILVTVIAVIQAWITRYQMNEDGISYLEIAAAYAHHAWSSAISAYWNPLYPLALAPALSMVRPSGPIAFLIAHCVNLLIFIVSLFCFRFFYTQAVAMHRTLWPSSLLSQVPSWVIDVTAFCLFLSCALDLITTTLVTPDLLTAALVFASVGLAIRMHILGAPWPRFILLGVLLALGYLAKPIMFLFGFGMIAAMLIAKRSSTWRFRHIALTALTFLIIAGPYVGLISSKEHRLTISDNGRLTYLFVVNKFPYGYPHGSHSEAVSDLKHPPKMLYSHPDVYDFSSPVAGTCPIWYDPSYWYEGVRVRFSPANELKQWIKNARTLTRIVLVRQAPLSMAVLVLLMVIAAPRRVAVNIWKQPILFIPAASALIAVFLFNLESRLIAPFLPVIWMCILGALHPEMKEANLRWIKPVLISSACLLFFGAISQIGAQAAAAGRDSSLEDSHSTKVDFSVARGLHQEGVPEGSQVAFVGNSISAYWAYLARVRIVAEIPAENQSEFIDANEATMRSVLLALRRTGATAVISQARPIFALAGWEPIRGTPFFLHLLR